MATFVSESTRGVYSFAGLRPMLDYACEKTLRNANDVLSLNTAARRMKPGRKYNRGKNRKVAKRFNKLEHSNGNYTYLYTRMRSSQRSFESKRNFVRGVCMFRSHLAGILSSECA